MSEQLWTELPFATQPNQDDELLLVNGEEQSRRITVKNLIYSQLAELSWTISGTQNVGVGTANQWGNLLFNGVSGHDWIQLNGDGSFALDDGIYFIEANFQFCLGDQTRFRLLNVTDGSTLIFRSVFHTATTIQVDLWLRKRLSLSAQKTLAIQINIASAAYNYGFFYNANTLSGFNPVIAQAFIWRLG
jgi:hypothetical protein